MGYVTENTAWPTSVELDPSVKELIDLFYTLADDKSSDAGPRLANEVFTKDATMGSSAGVAKGAEGTYWGSSVTKTEIGRSQVLTLIF